MPPNIMDQIVDINVSLLPPPLVYTGLDELVILVPQGVVAGGNVFTVTDGEDVAALLAATNITADGEAVLNLALSQSPHPNLIRVVTYTTTNLDVALALMQAQVSWSPGMIMIRGINDVSADLIDIGAFIALNRWKYAWVIEAVAAGLLSNGKPAALAALEGFEEVAVVKVAAASTGASQGAAFASRSAAFQMVGANGSPLASRIRLEGVTPATFTSTELANLVANGAMTALQLDAGNSALERVMYGTYTYGTDGDYKVGWTPATSMVFAVRQVRAGIKELLLKKSIEGKPILATPSGVALVEDAVNAKLNPMRAAGHFVENEVYPKGFSVSGEVQGDEIITSVYLRLPQEVRLFTFNMVGEIV